MRGAVDDRGETLVEILVAVTIMGIASSAFIGGLLMNIQGSDIHAKQATAQALVRDYAEAVVNHGFQGCTGGYSAAAVGVTLPANYISSVTSSCSGGTATGPATVTLVVSSTDGRASEQTVVVLRDSCATLPC
jgi:prepilin-type N-terminal cleavage/methylation domain-containing protein